MRKKGSKSSSLVAPGGGGTGEGGAGGGAPVAGKPARLPRALRGGAVGSGWPWQRRGRRACAVRPEGAGPRPKASLRVSGPLSPPSAPSSPSQLRPQSPPLDRTKAKCPPSSEAAALLGAPGLAVLRLVPGVPLPGSPLAQPASCSYPDAADGTAPPALCALPPPAQPAGRCRTAWGGGLAAGGGHAAHPIPGRLAPSSRPPQPLAGPFTLMQYGGSS